MIDISVDTVCTIITQARALALGADADGEEHDPNAQGHENLIHGDVDDDEFPDDHEAYDAGDEEDLDASEEHDALEEFIDNLNEDEQIELVVISWIGRGTYTVDEWDDAADNARNEHTEHTGEYLLGQPRLADFLEEGLSQLGFSCEE